MRIYVHVKRKKKRFVIYIFLDFHLVGKIKPWTYDHHQGHTQIYIQISINVYVCVYLKRISEKYYVFWKMSKLTLSEFLVQYILNFLILYKYIF